MSSPFLTGAAIVDLRETSGCFAVGGKDAFDYLQRQLSNDLKKLSDQHGAPSTLMNRKGKMIAAFDIYRRGESFLVVCERAALAALAESLERLVILENVTFEREESLGALLSVQGPEAERVLAAMPKAGVFVMRRPRSRAGGFDILAPATELEPLRAALRAHGAIDVDLAGAEAARIDAGIPRFGIDADTSNLPPESGYGSAISYSKGCFVGQEIVARIRTYGHVNQLLCLLRGEGTSVPSPGTEIHDGAQNAGRVTSAALSPTDGRAVALGYLKHDVATARSRVSAGGIDLSVEPLA